MNISFVSICFYRPLRRASSFLADRLLIPTFEQVHLIAKSVLGQTIIHAGLETTGAILGTAIGTVLVEAACEKGLFLLPYGFTASLVYALATKKKMLAQASFLAIVSKGILPTELRCASLDIFKWATRAGFTIMGGYFGLKCAGSKICLINRVEPRNFYALNMLKFLLAGAVFETTIHEASFPYLAPFINFPRRLTKSVLQTAAYSSQDVILFVQKCFREKRMVSPVAFALKVVCHRYCLENASSIAIKATQSLSKKIFPLIVLQDPLCSKIQSQIEAIGEASDQIVHTLMRGFCEYRKIVIKIQEELNFDSLESDDLVNVSKKNKNLADMDASCLETALHAKILNKKWGLSFLDQAVEAQVLTWAGKAVETILTQDDHLVKALQEMEIELVGWQFLNKKRANALKSVLPIHLKYFFAYLFLNHSTLKHPISHLEEREFFQDLASAFFSIYASSSIFRAIKTPMQWAIQQFYQLHHFLKPIDEQDAWIDKDPIFINDHINELSDCKLQRPQEVLPSQKLHIRLNETYFQTS